MANIVQYEARDGTAVELTFEYLKKFLIRGKPEAIASVTPPEMVLAMGVMKARGLNPFALDCYALKFTRDDPLAIVVSVDFKRARARAQKDCQGWKSGIIYMLDDVGPNYREGCLLLGAETLLGGWFEAAPKGWIVPYRLELPLAPFIKRKSDGNPTKFWAKDNQPYMIWKVAEAQGLTRVWPGEFAKTYTVEEVDSGAFMDDMMDLSGVDIPQDTGKQVDPGKTKQAEKSEPAGAGSPGQSPEDPIAKFDKMILPDTDMQALGNYLKLVAGHYKTTIEGAKTMIMKENEFPKFWTSFLTWWKAELSKEGKSAENPPSSGQVQSDQPASKAEALKLEIGKLHAQGLKAWESQNKERIQNLSSDELIVFKVKWKKTIGADYNFFPQKEAEKPQDPPPAGEPKYRKCPQDQNRSVPVAARCKDCGSAPDCEAKEKFLGEAARYEEELSMRKFNQALMAEGFKELGDVTPDKYQAVLGRLLAELDGQKV